MRVLKAYGAIFLRLTIENLKTCTGMSMMRDFVMPNLSVVESQTNPLTQLELDHLAEVREVCRTVNTSGWQRILQQMKAFVEEASEDMIGATYASDSIKAALQMRWQQRTAMLRGVEKYISECEFKRQLLVEEMKESSSNAKDRTVGIAD